MGDTVIVSLSIAFLMGLLLGTPSWFPHPGRLLAWSVRRLYFLTREMRYAEQVCGIVFMVAVSVGILLVTLLLLFLVDAVSIEAYIIFSVLLLYASLLPGTMSRECDNIRSCLERGDPAGARAHLSKLVGGDVGEMSAENISRTTIELTAERSVTDVIAPIFYALIGGPAAAVAYRAVAVAHATVKIQEPRFSPFLAVTGNVAYVLDFVPARIALALTLFASWFNRYDLRQCWTCVQRDGLIHLDPNVGLMKAAYAGAIGIQLGGTNYFLGGTSTMPLIGESHKEADAADIRRSADIASTVAVSGFLTGVAIRVLIVAFLSLFTQSCKTEVVAAPTATPATAEGIDIGGTWKGTWQSASIPEAKGSMECIIRREEGRWRLVGDCAAEGGAVVRKVELWGKPASDVVNFEGRTDFGANGIFGWSALCSIDSCRGTFKGKTDEGSFILQKQ